MRHNLTQLYKTQLIKPRRY